jgi:hypothetical protein
MREECFDGLLGGAMEAFRALFGVTILSMLGWRRNNSRILVFVTAVGMDRYGVNTNEKQLALVRRGALLTGITTHISWLLSCWHWMGWDGMVRMRKMRNVPGVDDTTLHGQLLA